MARASGGGELLVRHLGHVLPEELLHVGMPGVHPLGLSAMFMTNVGSELVDDAAERRAHVLLAHLVAGTALLREELLALLGELVIGRAEHDHFGDRPDPVLELEFGEAARVGWRGRSGRGRAAIPGPGGTVTGAAGNQDEAEQDRVAPDTD